MQHAAIEPLEAVSVNHPGFGRLWHSIASRPTMASRGIIDFPRPGHAANSHPPPACRYDTVSVLSS